ncbi:hypothetical protein NMG60_11021261 [Bertholletia excelsa]
MPYLQSASIQPTTIARCRENSIDTHCPVSLRFVRAIRFLEDEVAKTSCRRLQSPKVQSANLCRRSELHGYPLAFMAGLQLQIFYNCFLTQNLLLLVSLSFRFPQFTANKYRVVHHSQTGLSKSRSIEAVRSHSTD